MIKDYDSFKKFEDDLISKEKIDIEKNFVIVEEMYNEAVALGIFPLKDPLDDIDIDIKIAKVVNSVSKLNKKNSF